MVEEEDGEEKDRERRMSCLGAKESESGKQLKPRERATVPGRVEG